MQSLKTADERYAFLHDPERNALWESLGADYDNAIRHDKKLDLKDGLLPREHIKKNMDDCKNQCSQIIENYAQKIIDRATEYENTLER